MSYSTKLCKTIGAYRSIRALAPLVAVVLMVTVGCNSDYRAGVDAYHAQDYELAMQKLRPVADGQSSEAKFYVGLMHYRGEGVEQNHAEAAGNYVKPGLRRAASGLT